MLSKCRSSFVLSPAEWYNIVHLRDTDETEEL